MDDLELLNKNKDILESQLVHLRRYGHTLLLVNTPQGPFVVYNGCIGCIHDGLIKFMMDNPSNHDEEVRH